MLFGWAFLLLIPLSLIAGPVLGLVVWLLTRGRRGSLPLALTCAAVPLVFLLALGFAFFSPWVLSEGKDWDTGSLDTFRTPLGGGYFATSIDSFLETGYLEVSERTAPAPGGYMTVSGLGCWQGVTFLSLESGRSYALVRADERRLEVFPNKSRLAAALGAPSERALSWTNRSGFSSTPCSPGAPPLDSTLGLGVLLGIPLLLLTAGLGLVLWFVRVRRAPVRAPRPSEEW